MSTLIHSSITLNLKANLYMAAFAGSQLIRELFGIFGAVKQKSCPCKKE